MKTIALSLTIGLLATVSAVADSIVIEGRSYDNVLVYESDRFYFVKIPQMAEVISVAKSNPRVSEPTINNDPTYRQELREMYDRVKDSGGARPQTSANSAFQVEEPSDGQSVDASSLLGGGAENAKPMNVTVQQAKDAFKMLEVEFSGSGDSINGSSPDGSVNVTINSKGGKVSFVSGSISASDPAAMQRKSIGVMQMMGSVAPWSQQWIMSNLQTLMTGGALQKTQDGVAISLSPSGDGLSFSVKGA